MSATKQRNRRPVNPTLLTIDQVAQTLQCSPRTVHNLLADGRLSGLKIGTLRRIPVGQVEALIAAGISTCNPSSIQTNHS